MHQLKKQNPGKTFIPASDKLICLDMKRITLDDILTSLLEMKHVVAIPEEIRGSRGSRPEQDAGGIEITVHSSHLRFTFTVKNSKPTTDNRQPVTVNCYFRS